MKISEEKISLLNLAEGAAVERFDIELQKILNNVNDINTDAETIRKVTLEVQIKPDLDRQQIAIGFKVIGKTAPLSPMVTYAYLEKDVHGQSEAFEMVKPKQQNLPFNVTSIKEKQEAK